MPISFFYWIICSAGIIVVAAIIIFNGTVEVGEMEEEHHPKVGDVARMVGEEGVVDDVVALHPHSYPPATSRATGGSQDIQGC